MSKEMAYNGYVHINFMSISTKFDVGWISSLHSGLENVACFQRFNNLVEGSGHQPSAPHGARAATKVQSDAVRRRSAKSGYVPSKPPFSFGKLEAQIRKKEKSLIESGP